jgi:GTP-binding protein
MVGRSNVGKSSLINAVLNRKGVARVSQTPGKTQAVQFYLINDKFYLVDLPGYGYAKVPKSLRERWRPLIDSYLHGTEVLAGVVQLIDLRHGPTADDLVAIEQLAAAEIPVLFALTKADKLKPRQREQAIRDVAGRLGAELDQVIAVSSFSGEGRDALLETLGALLEQDSAVGIQDSGSPTED